MKEFIHQGDCQLITSAVPKTAKKIIKKPLALGEQSGHQHVVTGEYDLLEDEDGTLYVSTGNAECLLQHIHESVFKTFETTEELTKADHNVVKLQPNTVYKLGIHKKYDPFKATWEKVID